MNKVLLWNESEYMSPCFLWQTATDELVPVQRIGTGE